MQFSWVEWKNNQFPPPSDLALDTALEQSSRFEVLIRARHSPQRSPQIPPGWFGGKCRLQSVSEHLPWRGHLHLFSKTLTTIKSDFIIFLLLSSSLVLLPKPPRFPGSFHLWLNLFFFFLCHGIVMNIYAPADLQRVGFVQTFTKFISIT